MGAAVPIVASLAAPFIGQLVGGITQSFLGGSGASGGANSLFGPILGPLLNQFTSAFQPLLGQAGANPSAMQVAPLPTPFSTSSMSPQSFYDPISRLRPSLDSFQSIGNRSTAFASDPIVRDHRHPEGSADVIVRDHRHPEGSGPIVVQRPPIPPPAAPPTRVNTGDSGGGVLNGLQSDVDQAKQALLQDPTNPQAALNLQEAMQALQTVSSLLSQESAMYASIENQMIQHSKVS